MVSDNPCSVTNVPPGTGGSWRWFQGAQGRFWRLKGGRGEETVGGTCQEPQTRHPGSSAPPPSQGPNEFTAMTTCFWTSVWSKPPPSSAWMLQWPLVWSTSLHSTLPSTLHSFAKGKFDDPTRILWGVSAALEIKSTTLKSGHHPQSPSMPPPSSCAENQLLVIPPGTSL